MSSLPVASTPSAEPRPPCPAQALRLRYTPRRFVIHPDHKTLLVAEADHAAIPASEREPLPSLENGDAMQEDGTPLTPEQLREQGAGGLPCC